MQLTLFTSRSGQGQLEQRCPCQQAGGVSLIAQWKGDQVPLGSATYWFVANITHLLLVVLKQKLHPGRSFLASDNSGSVEGGSIAFWQHFR